MLSSTSSRSIGDILSVNDLFAWKSSNFRHDKPSRFDEKKLKQSAAEANWDKVKRLTFIRDDGRCRVCGQLISRNATNLLERADPHHIMRASKGRVDETWNIVWLCRADHDLVHVKRTLRIEGDADVAVSIWSLGDDGVWFELKKETGIREYERD